MNSKKITTILIVLATLILAGVAIFTALRVYRQGQEPVAPSAPGSQPFAWDCSSYTFSMDNEGVVSVSNGSSRDEPSQTAEVYINDDLIATFEVPALSPGDQSILGNITVPSEPFTWRVVGTRDCQNSGQSTPAVNICESLAFEIQEVSTQNPTSTPTPSPTGTSSPSPTPTDSSIGGGPTNTPRPTATDTPTATPTSGQTASNPTPTPTTGNIAQANSPTPTTGSTSQTTPTDSGTTAASGDELPDSGFDDPITLFLASSMLLIVGAFILAL